MWCNLRERSGSCSASGIKAGSGTGSTESTESVMKGNSNDVDMSQLDSDTLSMLNTDDWFTVLPDFLVSTGKPAPKFLPISQFRTGSNLNQTTNYGNITDVIDNLNPENLLPSEVNETINQGMENLYAATTDMTASAAATASETLGYKNT